MKFMKAVRIHEYGGRETLCYEDARVPEPKAGELLVRVKAAAVNPIDVQVREGRLEKLLGHVLPLILGWDASGVIEDIGEGVSKFDVGDAIFARPSTKGQGTYAEYAIIHEREAAFKPQTLDHTRAAAVPLAALTAWQALFEAGKLSEGQTVLIHGAAGGVGHFAVQFAKRAGARVLATASARNQDFVSRLGADEVFDYGTVRFEEAADDVDVVLDTVGGETQERSFGVLKEQGRLISVVSEPSQGLAEAHNVQAQLLIAKPDGGLLALISKMLDRGEVAPTVEIVLPLAETRRAHELIESGHTRGKVVLNTIAS
jgi:NADPH:quinone reductase-like Zn-dependent oxidoreductase